MKGGRTPDTSGALPPDPLRGWLVRVSYIDNSGSTHSRMFRHVYAARGFAARVREAGGSPRVHRIELSEWTEIPISPRWGAS